MKIKITISYLDLPGIVALCAPGPLWLADEGAEPSIPQKAFKAAGKPEALSVYSGEQPVQSGLDWLLSEQTDHTATD